jgi:hypothetical protein
MANNVPIPGVGSATAATEQLGTGEHVQLIKLVDGTPGSTARVAAGVNGLAVDVKAVVLPAGAATEATLATALTRLSSILTQLQATIAVTGTVAVSNPTTGTPDVTDRTGRLLGHVTVDTAPTTAVTGPLTDGQLRATPVPVSGFPVTQPVSGTVTVANPTTGSPDVTDRAARLLGHVTVDSAPTTVVTGPATDTQLRATPLPVTGSVTTPALTDTQLRASAVPVSSTVTNFPASQAVTGPQTDAQARATPQPVSGTVAITGSEDTRFAGGKTPYAQVLSTAGDTTIVTPSGGQRVRMVWVAFVPNSDNTAANLVTVKFTTGSTPYVGYALSHWEVFDGPVNQPLVVNLANTQPVAVTIHYLLV